MYVNHTAMRYSIALPFHSFFNPVSGCFDALQFVICLELTFEGKKDEAWTLKLILAMNKYFHLRWDVGLLDNLWPVLLSPFLCNIKQAVRCTISEKERNTYNPFPKHPLRLADIKILSM